MWSGAFCVIAITATYSCSQAVVGGKAGARLDAGQSYSGFAANQSMHVGMLQRIGIPRATCRVRAHHQWSPAPVMPSFSNAAGRQEIAGPGRARCMYGERPERG